MGKFEDGNTYGKGRIKGSRNQSTLWLDALGAEDVEVVIQAVKKKAKKGDLRACAIVLARVWPSRRSRAIEIDLPAIGDSAGLMKAQDVLVQSLAQGEITPDEASSVSNLLENQRRAIELHDYGVRLDRLEGKDGDPPAEDKKDDDRFFPMANLVEAVDSNKDKT